MDRPIVERTWATEKKQNVNRQNYYVEKLIEKIVIPRLW